MKYLSVLATSLLVLNLSETPEVLAQQQANHVVSADQLRASLVARSAERSKNIQEIQELLSHEQVRSRIGALANLDKVEEAIPTLDDVTLSQLAAASRPISDRLQAGLSTGRWIEIVAVAVALIIFLAVYNSIGG